MSRLDYVTIAIIVVCAGALAVLIWKTVSLRNQDTAPDKTENTLQDYEYDYYNDTTAILPPTDDEPKAGEMEAPTGGQTKTTSEAQNTAQTNRPSAMEDRPVTTTSRGGEYLVLAGSFKIKSNAESQAQKLRNMGYNNASSEIFNKGAYAVVMVDRFGSESEAQNLVNELKKKGVDSYVHQKREQD